MKGLTYLLAGSLTLNTMGCDAPVYKRAGEWSCEQSGNDMYAINGEKYVHYRYDSTRVGVLVYGKVGFEEAVKAAKACSEAFGKKIE